MSEDLKAVSLRRIIPGASFVGCGDVVVSSLAQHHQDCRPGSLFAVIRGTRCDGRRYIDQALAAGACALLVDRPLTGVAVPQCVVTNVRREYAQLCYVFAGQPQRRLRLFGVTGTNGKTTVSWLLRSILQADGRETGILGTIEYSVGSTRRPANTTTPAPEQASRWFREMHTAGATDAVLEVSSHALHQSRLGNPGLAGAIVTNVTQDHLDYHGDMEAYTAAKRQIGDICRPDAPIVVNADDPRAIEIGRAHATPRRQVIMCGIDSAGTDASAEIRNTSAYGTAVGLRIFDTVIGFETHLVGAHNAANCLLAATLAHAVGVSAEAIASGINDVRLVPGRLEAIERGQPFRVFVDYAHTPDALERVIRALRPTTAGRLFCVFGAGGDRDRSKRPLLGRAASGADVAIVTSDNPRSEDPQEIAGQVAAGLAGCRGRIEIDRREAIHCAIREASAGDCVLIAGKGHETSQQIGMTQCPFDDRLAAAEALDHVLSQKRVA